MKSIAYPLNPLASDGALGSAGPLLRALINELPTCVFKTPNTKHIITTNQLS